MWDIKYKISIVNHLDKLHMPYHSLCRLILDMLQFHPNRNAGVGTFADEADRDRRYSSWGVSNHGLGGNDEPDMCMLRCGCAWVWDLGVSLGMRLMLNRGSGGFSF